MTLTFFSSIVRISAIFASGCWLWFERVAAQEVPGTITMIRQQAEWRYLDDGSDQGTAWTAPGFDDSIWMTGVGQFGYGDGDEATRVNSGPSTQKFVTTYFRKSVVLPDDFGAYETLRIEVLADDGAAVHVNGATLVLQNLNANPRFNSLATTTVQNNNENRYFRHDFAMADLPAGTLRAGLNVIAAEVHQADRTSSDLGFDLRMSLVTPAYEEGRPIFPDPGQGFASVVEGHLRAGSPGELFLDQSFYSRLLILGKGAVDVYAAHLLAVSEIIAMADLDGDGDTDVIDASDPAFRKQIAVAENTGGSFNWNTVYDADGASPEVVIRASVGDMNNDGLLDLVIGSQTDHPAIDDRIDYLPNLGEMKFGPLVPMPMGNAGKLLYEAEIVPAHLNADKLVDLIIVSPQSNLRVMLRQPDGSLESAPELPFRADRGSLFPVDLNGDGVDDLVSTLGSALNDGNGGFGVPIPFPGDPEGAAQPFDLEGDGDMDVVVFGRAAAAEDPNVRQYYWAVNDGTGILTDTAVIVEYHPIWFPFSGGPVSCLDYDGDGLKDILIGASWHRRKPSLSLDLEDLSVTTTGMPGRTTVTLTWSGDKAGRVLIDGAPALGTTATINVERTRSITIERQLDDISVKVEKTIDVSLFNPEHTHLVPEPGESNLRIATGDIDGDGLVDSVVAGRGTGSDGSSVLGFAWSRNTGSGTFQPQPFVTWESPYVANDLLLADIDGDADLDITLKSDFELTRWFANDGAGSFSGPNDFGQVGVSRKLDLADIDMDGDLDALVTFGDFSSLYVHENQGGGKFASDQILIPGRVDDFTVVDADGDGDGDIMALVDGYITLFHLAKGIVSDSGIQIERRDAYSYMSTFDYDDDGDSDVLQIDLVYVNDGGDFTSVPRVPSSFPSAHSGAKPIAADLDGDGMQDIFDRESFRWVRWTERGFVDELAIAVPEGATDFTFEDIDGDGDFDYLFSRFGGGWGWVLNSAMPVQQEENGLPFAVSLIESVEDAGFTLHWTTPETDADYSIEFSKDMVNWEPLTGGELKSRPSGINATSVDLSALPLAAEQMFFRLLRK